MSVLAPLTWPSYYASVRLKGTPKGPHLSLPPSTHASDHHPFHKLYGLWLPAACQGCWPGHCLAAVPFLTTHPTTPGLGDAQPLLALDEGCIEIKSQILNPIAQGSAGRTRFCRAPNKSVQFRGRKLPGGARGGEAGEGAQPHTATWGHIR